MEETLKNPESELKGNASGNAEDSEGGSSFLIYRLIALADQNRSTAALIGCVLLITLLDIIFDRFLFEPYVSLIETLSGSKPGEFAEVDIGFAPEVWQAILAMVLGTLILVISIASQSIPKLIDLYMKDLTSLIYVWFLIASGAHAGVIKLYGEIGLVRESSRVFNSHFLMSFCAIVAFPYIFFILRYTKPTNIIAKIYGNNMDLIKSLVTPRNHALVKNESVVASQQYTMFESLNQLDDILEYVSFKELKGDIIYDMGRTMRNYLKIKPYLHPDFFRVTQKVRSDISFKTLVGQYEEMERTRSFYEQKCFRLMNNNYIKLMELGEFDLSSMIAGEVAKIGQTAIECEEEEIVEIVIIRFNTFFRMAIKHALRNNEPRNIYNLAFFYGQFIFHLVEHKKIDQVKKCFMYLRMYGIEIARQFAGVPSVYFNVAVIACEMKKLLEQIYNDRWDMEIQTALVNEILQVDNPPDFNKEDLDQGIMINNGVRWIQFGLALFYHHEKVEEFVERIAKDILDDLDDLGEATFYRVLGMTEGMMRFAGPSFWEDTDRGNLNIFFTPHKDDITPFKQLLLDLAKDHLILKAKNKYLLTDFEVEYLWELSRDAKEKELAQLTDNIVNFEKMVLEQGELEKEKLDALIRIREKLRFNSDNPAVVVTTSRQIAVGTELEVSGKVGDQKTRHQFKAVVMFNSINLMYISLSAQKGSVPPVAKMAQLTLRFKPPRQRTYYQCRLPFEGTGQDGMFRLGHSDSVKITEES